MKKMEKMAAMAMMAMLPVAAAAQDNVEATIQADVVNQYIWRGQDCGNASLQPTLGVSWKGLSLTAWGSVGITESTDTKEFDLTLAYENSGFNVGLTDYWFNTGDGRYFSYEAHKTAHMLEANVGYDFGPVSLQWFTYIAGADYNKPSNGDRAYSSYVELTAPFNLGGLSWEATVGAVPYKTLLYSDAEGGFAVTNVSLTATKALKITPTFELPVFAGITANPSNERAYLLFGFSLVP